MENVNWGRRILPDVFSKNSRTKLRLGEAGESNENFSITNFRELAILKLKRYNYGVRSTVQAEVVKREFSYVEEKIAE